jgi:hypothetical protein
MSAQSPVLSGKAYIEPSYDLSFATQVPTYAQVSVGASAQTLAQLGVTIPPWAQMVNVTAETGAIRYRCDGVAPTASIGQPIAQNTPWQIKGPNAIAATQFIAGSATTVSLEFRG